MWLPLQIALALERKGLHTPAGGAIRSAAPLSLKVSSPSRLAAGRGPRRQART